MKSTKITAKRKWSIKLNIEYRPNTIKGLNLNRGTHIRHPSPGLGTGLNDVWEIDSLVNTSVYHILYFHKELLSAGGATEKQAVNPV